MLFRKILKRRRLDSEMREEFEFHIQARVDDLMRSGTSRDAARRQAAIEFGGVEKHKESIRDVRRILLIEDFVRDLGYALRSLRREPLFALSAAGALALGVAVNAALFSFAYGLLFRPLPASDPDSLRNVWLSARGEHRRSSYGSRYNVSAAEFDFLRVHAHGAELAGVAEANLVASFASSPLHTQLVSDNLLRLLGARPAAGRFFTADETRDPGTATVMVMSHSAWQRYFGGEDVVGRRIVVNRTPFTIVGVADERTSGPLILKAEAWIPLAMQPMTRAGEPLIYDANAAWIQVLARIRPGVADPALRAELQVLQQRALAQHAPGMKAEAVVTRAALFNSPEFLRDGTPILWILLLAVSLVLMVACANVANMLLARGLTRTRELAIRLSLGAGKGRVVRQLMTENLVLALLGGAIGLALSQLILRAALSALPPDAAGHQIQIAPDLSIVAWTVLVSLIAGALFGLPPALNLLRRDLGPAARAGRVQFRGRRRLSWQSALVVAQVAMSAVLLTNAALLVRALASALNMDLGQATRNVLIATPNLRQMRYTQPEAQRYLEELQRRVEAMPGVRTASLTGFDPYLHTCGTMVAPIMPDGSEAAGAPAGCHEVGPEYFAAMDKRIVQGRAFSRTDQDASSSAAIVDADFASRHFGGQALGRRFKIGSERWEIVGVVSPTKALRRSHGPEVYFPLRGGRYLESTLVVAYDGPRDALAQAIRLEGARLDRDLPVAVKPIEQNVAEALGPVRSAAIGAAALGGLALLLAGAGVYGVVAFTVGRRRREIGIRMALGAERAGVLRLVVGQASRPVLIGAALGVALAAGAAQLIRAMLFGISPLDPVSLSAAIAVLIAVAAIASVAPARSAMHVDPATTLRDE